MRAFGEHRRLLRRASAFLGASLAIQGWQADASAYRPFSGTDAAVADVSEVELEVGPAGLRRQRGVAALVSPVVVANYGLLPAVEAVAEGQQALRLGRLDGDARSRLEDPALSLKGVLRPGALQQRPGPSLALEAGLLFPSSDPAWGAHLTSILSVALPAVVLHLNLGNELRQGPRYAASASIIAEGRLPGSLRPVAEVLTERDFGSARLAKGLAASLLVGAILRASDTLSFDGALRAGREGGTSVQEARLGFTWAFATPWADPKP